MKEGWELKKLGEVCEYIKQQGKYDLPYVGMEHITSKTSQYIGENKDIEVLSNTFKFKKGDILYGRLRPYLQKVWLATFDGHCSTEIFPIRTKQNFHPSFLKYWLLSEEVTTLINGTCTGARMPRANMNEVLNFNIPTPSLSEQQRIVEILDTAFAKIDTVKQNAERNLQNAKELFQSVLTNSYNNKSDFEYLKYLASIKTGKLNANAAVENGIYPFFTCSREVYSIDKYAFDCEALLLPGNNASGDFNVKHYKGKFNAYQRTYVITVNTQKLAYRYLYYRLLLSLSELKRDANGTNTKFIKIGMIESITIPKISLSQQQQIVSKLDTLSAKCKELENNYLKTINDCDELKKAILAKAFNGEL